MIYDFKELDLNKRYTYADYLTWQFEEMVELIKGRVFRMSPAPSREHQEISGNLHGILWQYLRNNPCQVFHAPFDVRLPLPKGQATDDKVDTVVQPDICVVCDLEKLDDRGCNGAPDWVIEILSASTSRKDLTEKFDIYQHSGVKEYWVVHPHDKTILTYVLDEQNEYQLTRKRPYHLGEKIPVMVFPDLKMDVDEIF